MTSFEFENGGCNGRSGSGAAVLILSFFLQGSSSSALEGEWCSGWSPSQVIIPQPSQAWTLSEEKDNKTLSHRSVEVARRDHTCSCFPAPGRPTRLVKYLLMCCLLNYQSYFHVFSQIILEVLSFLTYCALYILLRPISESLNTENFWHQWEHKCDTSGRAGT